jgi:hypothetical protein
MDILYIKIDLLFTSNFVPKKFLESEVPSKSYGHPKFQAVLLVDRRKKFPYNLCPMACYMSKNIYFFSGTQICKNNLCPTFPFGLMAVPVHPLWTGT